MDVVDLQKSAIDENEIDSIITDHKPDFTIEEWAKIVWFESYFSKTVDCTASDYEDIVSLKYSKFQSLLSFKEACNHLVCVVNKDIKTREKRLSNAEELNKVELKATEKHHKVIKSGFRTIDLIPCVHQDKTEFSGLQTL